MQKLKPDADGGLVCEQTAEIYPIRSGIPILITGEETPLASLSLN